ncbi:probable tRNA [Caerostris extrusa]|uniref:tRNA (uracil-O(2)-)-methyltransferase n=1 Tax=Caerostris extrusa TaxID=172846 RepID=A0AAV4PH05_CAEEX|nr:probable tRNA [Caerostris extrusa]
MHRWFWLPMPQGRFWAQERKLKNLTKKQTFIDLGCGNGLLDHILSSEGYKGIGIDLKKRKIWDIYGHETNLEASLFINLIWLYTCACN